MTRLRIAVLGASVLVVLAVGARSAFAQVPDHLKCHRVKASTKVKGLVDLVPGQAGLPVARDCKVRGPVLFCTAVVKTNVRFDPPPPGAPAGAAETDHFCYKLKCPRPFPGPVTATDQFGTFDVEPKGASLLCTPAVRQVVPTTSTTTTTLPPPCLEPLPETAETVEDAVAFGLARVLAIASTCGGNPEVCCGLPPDSCPVTVTPDSVTVTPSGPTFDFVAAVGIVTPSPFPISYDTGLFVVNCDVTVDSTFAGSPTVQLTGSMQLTSQKAGDPINRADLVSIDVSGLDSGDISLGGGFVCQIADLFVGAFVGTIESQLVSAFRGGVCRECGAATLSGCPARPEP